AAAAAAAAAAANALMRVSITHRTRYRYSTEVIESQMELRLRPWDGPGQRVHDFRLDVRPAARVRTYVDGLGNHVQHFNRLEPHDELAIVSRSTVETWPAEAAPSRDLVPSDLLLFRPPVLSTAAVRRLARRARLHESGSPHDLLAALDRISDLVASTLTYMPDVTTVSSDVEEVLKLGRGVCQDFAHVFIAVARTVGIPCRYVSGYVAPEPAEPYVGASHAWAEAWVPGRGWRAYDPTHPGLPAELYIRLAVGRDYRDAAPTRGVFVGPAASAMEASVEIRPEPAHRAG
ncbi:MAG TPA: transglutaminase family protein, partial [Candidatus Dormibacteraeota bacterium]|nr:transglutaminase family protein [Candidatus Dormibacteraeota bacterium]